MEERFDLPERGVHPWRAELDAPRRAWRAWILGTCGMLGCAAFSSATDVLPSRADPALPVSRGSVSTMRPSGAGPAESPPLPGRIGAETRGATREAGPRG